MRTVIRATTDWPNLAAMSRRLTKLDAQHRPRDSLVFIANHSQGERNVLPAKLLVAQVIRDVEFNGGWHGFRETGAEQFQWTSSKRNAVLLATRQGKRWRLEYTGPGFPFYRESGYLMEFIKTVDLETLRIKSVRDRRGLRAWYRKMVEVTTASGDTQLGEKLSAFIQAVEGYMRKEGKGTAVQPPQQRPETA